MNAMKVLNPKHFLLNNRKIRTGIKLQCVWPQSTTINKINLKTYLLINSEVKSFECNFKNFNKMFKRRV